MNSSSEVWRDPSLILPHKGGGDRLRPIALPVTLEDNTKLNSSRPRRARNSRSGRRTRRLPTSSCPEERRSPTTRRASRRAVRTRASGLA